MTSGEMYSLWKSGGNATRQTNRLTILKQYCILLI